MIELALKSGFPEAALARSDRVRAHFIESYLDQLLTRDAPAVAGTGKSELARLPCREPGVAGREDAEGHSPNAHERLTSLVLGNELLSWAATPCSSTGACRMGPERLSQGVPPPLGQAGEPAARQERFLVWFSSFKASPARSRMTRPSRTTSNRLSAPTSTDARCCVAPLRMTKVESWFGA